MVDVDRAFEIAEKIGNIISFILSLFLALQMLGDLLGINVIALLKQVVFKPWVIPWEVIRQYYWLWWEMEWCLLIIMLFDNVYTMRYMHVHGEPPPPSYVKAVSLATFLLSFWLMLVFRNMTFTLICIFSAISLSYVLFIKKE